MTDQLTKTAIAANAEANALTMIDVLRLTQIAERNEINPVEAIYLPETVKQAAAAARMTTRQFIVAMRDCAELVNFVKETIQKAMKEGE